MKKINHGPNVSLNAFKHFLNILKVKIVNFLIKYKWRTDFLARRSSVNGDIPIEFYDIIFLVSQLRSLSRRISQCLMNLPWPYIQNLPSFFYRIYLPSITNMSSILNSNYDPLTLSPVKSTLNSTNRYDNEFCSDSLNSNSIDVSMSKNNIGTSRDVPSNNETNFGTMPIMGSSSQVCYSVFLLLSIEIFPFRYHGVFQIWVQIVIHVHLLLPHLYQILEDFILE